MGFFKSLTSGKNVVKNTPDYTAAKNFYDEAAKLTKELGLDTLDWGKEQWASQQELLDRILKTQEGIAESRLGSAQDWQKQYETSIQPLEQQLIQDAVDYNTQARQDLEAGRAMSQTGQAFEAGRKKAQDRLESYGIDPSQTRASALDAQVRQQEAIAKVEAANEARRYVEDKGRQLRGQAIDLGQANMANARGAYGDVYNYGSGTLQNQLAGLQGGQQLSTAGIPLLGTAGQFYDARTGYADRDYANQLSRAQQENDKYSNITQGLGQIAGMATSAMGGGIPFAGAIPSFGGAQPSQPYYGAGGPSYAGGGGPTSFGRLPGFADGGYVGPNNSYYDENKAEGVNGAALPGMSAGPNQASGVPMPTGPVDGWSNVGTKDGAIQGPGGPKDDFIDAKLSNGEYVVPEEVVRRKGTEFFDKLIEKTRGAIPQAMAAGSAMVTAPPGSDPMGGAVGAIPTLACGGYVRKG